MSDPGPGRPGRDSEPTTLGRVALHLMRVGLLASVVWLVHEQHARHQAALRLQARPPVARERLQKFYPDIAATAERTTRAGAIVPLDADGVPLGFFIETSPAADDIVGYAGPTNVLVAFDQDGHVIGIEILASADTIEHVADVRDDDEFLYALAGRDWTTAAQTSDIDAVSGATLTSLAVLESISLRLSGEKPSLKFPDPLAVDEVKVFFPAAERLQAQASRPALFDVLDAQGERLGAVFRTSPAADDVVGYQGPTDTLVALDLDERVAGIRLRRSYDNEPYVGYVRDEPYFLEWFNGQTLAELGRFDPDQSDLEGVSGATMTSLSIGEALPRAARAVAEPVAATERRIVWSGRDAGTLAVLAVGLVISFSRLRGMRRLRLAFQLLLVGYFGFLNGDMLSQALLVGWAQNGPAWRLAPGLAMLTAAAFVVPVVTKRQPYCHHICPFGAAQQLIRNRLPWKLRLGRRAAAMLELIPGTLLLVVFLTALLHWPLNLAGIEPFDGFLFWIAGGASIAVAVTGLAFSAVVPMGYCRFGCPTGAMLNFARFHASSGRFTPRDAFAVTLVVVGVWLVFA